MSMKLNKVISVFCIRRDSFISVDNETGKICVSISTGEFKLSEVKKMKNYLGIAYSMSEDIKQDLKERELNELGGTE